MEYLNKSNEIAVTYLTRHGVFPITPFDGYPLWAKPIIESMQRGDRSAIGRDHFDLLTGGYLMFVCAAACKATDNVAAVEFACLAADDLVNQYLMLAHMKQQIVGGPPSNLERQSAIIRGAVASICCSSDYPECLLEIVPTGTEGKSAFRNRVNCDSRTVFPLSFESGLPPVRNPVNRPGVTERDAAK